MIGCRRKRKWIHSSLRGIEQHFNGKGVAVVTTVCLVKGVLLVAVIAGITLLITSVQILWVNMTTAVLLGLVLVFEVKEPGIPFWIFATQAITGSLSKIFWSRFCGAISNPSIVAGGH